MFIYRDKTGRWKPALLNLCKRLDCMFNYYRQYHKDGAHHGHSPRWSFPERPFSGSRRSHCFRSVEEDRIKKPRFGAERKSLTEFKTKNKGAYRRAHHAVHRFLSFADCFLFLFFFKKFSPEVDYNSIIEAGVPEHLMGQVETGNGFTQKHVLKKTLH